MQVLAILQYQQYWTLIKPCIIIKPARRHGYGVEDMSSETWNYIRDILLIIFNAGAVFVGGYVIGRYRKNKSEKQSKTHAEG